jgi:hypothetical protein
MEAVYSPENFVSTTILGSIKQTARYVQPMKMEQTG